MPLSLPTDGGSTLSFALAGFGQLALRSQMEPFETLFTAVLAMASLGSLAAVATRARTGGVVGERLGSESGHPGVRVALALVPAVAGGAAWVTLGGLPTLALATIAAVLVFNLLRPTAADRICGSEGVRRGWELRRFEELEEWRLIGEHLRFRLLGEWTAVPLDPSYHERVRARLEQLVPERESGFGRGIERQSPTAASS